MQAVTNVSNKRKASRKKNYNIEQNSTNI